MNRTFALAALCVVLTLPLVGQPERHDKAVFVDPRNEFYDKLKSDAEKFRNREVQKKKELRLDFSGISAPAGVAEFTSSWHNPPVTQGLSGMCWCFSTTSFFESEIHRLSGREIKLTELYMVYWEYVEKARGFVRERGNSAFGQGSEANAVPRIWKMYGVVPLSAYTGLLPGQTVHDHDAMFNEMKTYLQSVRTSCAWNEEEVIKTIRGIMNHYIGEPPAALTVNGKPMTPGEYLANVVKLNLDDYVNILSLMQKPYFQQVEYEVTDNWWHNTDYFNVPLDEFTSVIRNAIRKGYTLALGGDTSEPGYEGHAGIAVVATFDIPSAFIDENARQFRFGNGTTGDDHGIHLVGLAQKDGRDWYLIKDSGSGSRNNTHPGYYFYHEDYVKLKIVDFMVHRDVAEELLKRFAK